MMDKNMNPYVKEYKTVTNYIGWGLTIFVGLFTVLGVFQVILKDLLIQVLSAEIATSADGVVSCVVYLASFILPGIFIILILSRKGLYRPLRFQMKFLPRDLLLVPAAIGCLLSAAYLNSFLIDLIASEDFYLLFEVERESPYEPYEMLIMFVYTALVPAVCEEFLFRGVILENMIPYGRSAAIIGSSVLFGLMHQNPAQILYTTVGGIFLGYTYVKCRSVWIPMIIHFVNNAYSVMGDILYVNGDEMVADTVLLICMLIFVVIGLVCFIIHLDLDKRAEEKKYSEGSFGRILESGELYVERKLSSKRLSRGFFAPGMIVFCSLSLASMLLLLI
ncbi:MAG: CPBP family intramembrane metalloprotease [Ruminococcaceae bacterium]|nr:CPBP family intramembrane metalloprotease [Oscillospiraceae bacterium]